MTTDLWSLPVHTLLPIAAAVAALVVLAIIVILELSKTPAQEEEMIRGTAPIDSGHQAYTYLALFLDWY